nr:MAG TPA_asm: hypothetical protein [Bacteriophage sp.]
MRPVDADAIYNEALENHQKGEIEDWEFDSIINYLDGAPTLNVETIIRCKDCRYLGRELSKGLYSCDDYNLPYCELDSYCSHGRRKEETKHAAD